jgi:hypothetical protein
MEAGMSNQRTGKTHKAALGDGMQDMKMKIFFAHCSDILEEGGQEDAAFYFEQIVEHIISGKALPSDNRKEIARILGV